MLVTLNGLPKLKRFWPGDGEARPLFFSLEGFDYEGGPGRSHEGARATGRGVVYTRSLLSSLFIDLPELELRGVEDARPTPRLHS